MKITWHFRTEEITSRYWLLPTAITLLVVGLFPLALSISLPSRSYSAFFFADSGSLEGVRLLLSSVTTALMTVVGVMFSITIVVLQQAAAQYSPRVLDNFIRSPTSQVVLGFFIGTFMFCLLLLRQVKNVQGSPHENMALAVFLAILLAVICLGLLIQYINHIAHAIKSTSIIDSITKETIRSITNIEEDVGRLSGAIADSSNALIYSEPIEATARGYLQIHHWTRLRSILKNNSWRLEVRVIPGDYIDPDVGAIAVLYTAYAVPPRQLRQVRKTFQIGSFRKHAQDIRFGIRQLVDIALRALSPGTNDPTTAIEAIDGLSSILLKYVHHFASATELKIAPVGVVHTRQVSFGEIFSLAFDQIISFSHRHPSVLSRVIEVLLACRESCQNEMHREIIRQKIERLEDLLATLAG